MTLTITPEQFAAALHAAVAERGEEFVYPTSDSAHWGGWRAPRFDGDAGVCLYARTDVEEPACLIGDALHRCGVDIADLRDIGGDADDVLRELTDLPHYVRDAATAAQQMQDTGSTWGDALARYGTVILLAKEF